MAKAVLKSAPPQYCKGMLAEILEPIMGKGLIPADPQTWKVRRRAIAPGFHKKWLARMLGLFADRAEILTNNLRQQAATTKRTTTMPAKGVVVDMEERFCSVTLDIIGKAVFNYDFGSVTKESPIVKAVYRVLREAEHRSTSFIPYWNLPYADQWMGGQVEFRKDLTLLNDILADLIQQAVMTRQEASIEELEDRENDQDPSLLRFLVDMRGEDLTSSVLRDDLMTMLIAGHETTAAMLTWTLFELCRGDPALLQEVQTEVRTVLKDKDRPTDYDDLVAMKKLRYCLIESLRLYPEPPLLIRRARTDDTLPRGSSRLSEHAAGIQLLRGTDIFISTWNLHRGCLLSFRDNDRNLFCVGLYWCKHMSCKEQLSTTNIHGMLVEYNTNILTYRDKMDLEEQEKNWLLCLYVKPCKGLLSALVITIVVLKVRIVFIVNIHVGTFAHIFRKLIREYCSIRTRGNVFLPLISTKEDYIA